MNRQYVFRIVSTLDEKHEFPVNTEEIAEGEYKIPGDHPHVVGAIAREIAAAKGWKGEPASVTVSATPSLSKSTFIGPAAPAPVQGDR